MNNMYAMNHVVVRSDATHVAIAVIKHHPANEETGQPSWVGKPLVQVWAGDNAGWPVEVERLNVGGNTLFWGDNVGNNWRDLTTLLEYNSHTNTHDWGDKKGQPRYTLPEDVTPGTAHAEAWLDAQLLRDQF